VLLGVGEELARDDRGVADEMLGAGFRQAAFDVLPAEPDRLRPIVEDEDGVAAQRKTLLRASRSL
jgi:hypothetical protein